MRRTSLIVVTVAGLGIAQLCLLQSASAAPTQPSEPSRQEVEIEQELIDLMPLEEDARVQAFAALTEDFIAQVGEDHFGGAYTDDTGQLVVQTVDLDLAAAQTALSAASANSLLPGDDITVRDMPHSWTTLNEIVEQIPDQVVATVGKDKLVSAGPDVQQGQVVVTVAADALPAVAKLLTEQHGDAVSVVAGEFSGSRFDYRRVDADPHKGGAKWTREAETTGHEADDATCTSGFAMRRWSDGLIGMTTAGHCGAVGTAWWNHQTYLGQVTRRVYSPVTYADTDAAFIGPGSRREFGPRVWYGGRLTGVHWPVVGVIDEGTAYVGSRIVVSGANTGVSVGIVRQVNQTFCWPNDGCTRGLTRIECETPGYGGVCAQGGDSGAPCFSSKGGEPSTVMARGTLVGGISATQYMCTSITDVSAGLLASVVTTT